MREFKGIIHFHSSSSYDSRTDVKDIVKFAIKNELNFLILTDHDTVNGSLKLREEVRRNGLDIEVPIAAEYLTEYGDVIACFINNEISFTDFDDLVKKVRAQDGIILIPHPYSGHKNIDHLIKESDMVEIFNSRQSSEKDLKAKEIASKYNKITYVSPDAHHCSELKNGIVTYHGKGNLRELLLSEKYEWTKLVKTTPFKIYTSQVYKMFDRLNPFKAFIKSSLILVKSLIKQRISFFKKIS